MSFVKIHPRHTSEIQCPVLCPRILHPLTYFVSQTMLAPPFFILPQWNIPRQAPYCFFFWKKVWAVLWQNEWSPKNIRSKLSPSSTLSSPLGNKRPNLPSAQLPPAWITASDKVSQDFSVGISQRTSETHLLRGRASTAQQGRGWLDLNMTCPSDGLLIVWVCHLRSEIK